jgi:hypothetical protein
MFVILRYHTKPDMDVDRRRQSDVRHVRGQETSGRKVETTRSTVFLFPDLVLETKYEAYWA